MKEEADTRAAVAAWNGGIQTGIVWAVLAGALRAGLFLLFRTCGHRLQRRAKPLGG